MVCFCLTLFQGFPLPIFVVLRCVPLRNEEIHKQELFYRTQAMLLYFSRRFFSHVEAAAATVAGGEVESGRENLELQNHFMQCWIFCGWCEARARKKVLCIIKWKIFNDKLNLDHRDGRGEEGSGIKRDFWVEIVNKICMRKLNSINGWTVDLVKWTFLRPALDESSAMARVI